MSLIEVDVVDDVLDDSEDDGRDESDVFLSTLDL